MSEALVARIRYHIQKANFMGLKDAESTLLLGEAADAIEQLSADLELAKDWAGFWEEEAVEVLKKLQTIVAKIPKLNKQIDYLQEQVAYWQAKLVESMCGEFLAETEMPLPKPPKEERKDPCADCRFYPPSSLDGKPCCACDPSDPIMNCHDAKDEECDKCIF